MATRESTSQPFGEPTNIGAPINVDEVRESTLFLTENERTMYFASRRTGGNGGADIWVSNRGGVAEPWGEPSSLGPNINTPETEFSPWLTDEGKTIYFTRRQGDDRSTEDIFRATRNSLADPFGPAEALPDFENGVLEGAASISSDELTMFYQRQATPDSAFQIWVATRESTADEFTNQMNVNDFSLGSSINTDSAYVFTPFISPDWPAPGSKIYFGHAIVSEDWDVYEATWIPEPSSLLLITIGLLGLLRWRPKRS
jgi:hypothetical protein